jgi:hypothetical protein
MGCGSPLGYPDRSLDPDQRARRPDAHSVPPSGFLSLSAACSSRGFEALFHASRHVQGSFPPGAFPPRQPHATRRRAVPSCRYRLTCQEPRNRNHVAPFDETDRLQGFAPPESPFPPVRCYSFQQADPLMGFQLLSRASPLPAVVAPPSREEPPPLMPLVCGARSSACGLRTRRSFSRRGLAVLRT